MKAAKKASEFGSFGAGCLLLVDYVFAMKLLEDQASILDACRRIRMIPDSPERRDLAQALNKAAKSIKGTPLAAVAQDAGYFGIFMGENPGALERLAAFGVTVEGGFTE